METLSDLIGYPERYTDIIAAINARSTLALQQSIQSLSPQLHRNNLLVQLRRCIDTSWPAGFATCLDQAYAIEADVVEAAALAIPPDFLLRVLKSGRWPVNAPLRGETIPSVAW